MLFELNKHGSQKERRFWNILSQNQVFKLTNGALNLSIALLWVWLFILAMTSAKTCIQCWGSTKVLISTVRCMQYWPKNHWPGSVQTLSQQLMPKTVPVFIQKLCLIQQSWNFGKNIPLVTVPSLMQVYFKWITSRDRSHLSIFHLKLVDTPADCACFPTPHMYIRFNAACRQAVSLQLASISTQVRHICC